MLDVDSVFLLLVLTELKNSFQIKPGAVVMYNREAPWSSRCVSDLKVSTTGILILTFNNRKMEKVIIKIKLWVIIV